LTAAEVLDVLRRVEQRGRVETAHRLLQIVSGVLRLAVVTHRAERNVAADLVDALKTPEVKHHAAVLDPEALGHMLSEFDVYPGTAPVRAALRLAPMLFVRPGELRHAEWAEIDLSTKVWTIPAAKMKGGRDHAVPLATQAVAILEDLKLETGRSRFVFPSARGATRPMSNIAVLAALRRLGYDSATMTAHGFRATARTLLAEVLRERVDLVEHQLAHTVRDPLGRAYNRTEFLDDRRGMMQRWADWLDVQKARAAEAAKAKASAA
jgi:integrase